MDLYFLRHGKAEARSVKWRPDSKRPLTEKGEKHMERVARGIKSLDTELDVILTSPYARALRTAEILAEVFDPRKLVVTPHLSAEASAQDLLAEVNQNFAGPRRIILVGHEPFLSRLISMLLTGGEDMALELKKAGLCKLSVEKLVWGKCARLHWLLTPKQLVRLGKGG